jgi:hypothetical protein
MSRATTDPAPMMLCSAIVTPGVIVTDPPTQTSSAMVTGSGRPPPRGDG